MKTWRFPFEKSPESGKKGLQNRVAHDIIPRVSTIRRTDIGMSPSGKAPDFDSGISSVQIRPSQPYDPLAQQAEQLPFKQWVRGSNPRRVTKNPECASVRDFYLLPLHDSLFTNLRIRDFLTNQLIRFGTSIGANIREAFYAHGRSDFIAKLQIALKECSESEYWLELLIESGYYDDRTFLEQCIEVKKFLIASINTAKSNGN